MCLGVYWGVKGLCGLLCSGVLRCCESGVEWCVEWGGGLWVGVCEGGAQLVCSWCVVGV